jgi:hypothetical protein
MFRVASGYTNGGRGPAGTAREKDARVTLGSPSGGPFGRKRLPWDIISITSPSHHQPEANGFGREFVCAKDAVVGTNHGVGTNVTAVIPTVYRNCCVGRPPSGSGSGEVDPRSVNSTRQRNGNDARVGARPANRALGFHAERIVKTTAARGHAARKIRIFSVTALVATSRDVLRVVARHVTAETTARWPSNACRIVNASGCVAIPLPANGSAAWSTKGKGADDMR